MCLFSEWGKGRSVKAPRQMRFGWATCWGIGALFLGMVAAAESVGRQDLQVGRPMTAEAAYRVVGETFGVEVKVEEGLGEERVRVDLEAVTRAEAFDLLSRAVGHFWWQDEDGAIRVARDTPNRRSEVEGMVFRSFSLANARPGEVATALRSLNAGRVEVGEGQVRVELREGAVERAELVIEAMEGATEGVVVRWLETMKGMPVEAPDPGLGTEASRKLWFPRGERWETLQEAMEGAFGVDLVLDPSILQPGAGRLLLEEATLFEALEALTAPAARFWVPLGGRRILIAEDTPERRATWEPLGLAAFPLERAEPRAVREVLRQLGVRRTAVGTDPSVVLAADTPAGLAMARFVVRVADGTEQQVNAPRPLWLGTGSRPRLAEAQLLLDPATELARRLALERQGPPELRSHAAPATETPVSHGPTARVGSNGKVSPEGSIRLLRALRVDLGLHVAVERCHWPVPVGRLEAPSSAVGSERGAFLDAMAREHSLLWTALGSDTVLLAPDAPFPRSVVRHRGLAAIPLDDVPATTLRHRAEELGIDTVAVLEGPRPVLFALGDWEALQELMETAPSASPAPATGDQPAADSPRPGSNRSR